ncbi:biotin carboxylase N-terminal domain-containing protein [Arthrobacter sp. ISL-5]|uniref:acetyl/propionyl/methylcrotonyl-CoA carboxylase subunit alpha n=1 Tax=Arthrobacter sp. ISL-5 TaxID=2819111 RepID=UPI001BE99341|nr:biotin carboxylase N-terminal domain-containing protein [Arthrobacter sp. ISL-5]MBT2551745.1 acetyl/propionyl-CoA carboxylase subunit alpha [Arthrobacter sp. ISL-5]
MTTRTFDTVLVANRGEIACRVIRTLRRLGITSVAVYSEADADARHVREADIAVCIGPAAATESYLKIEAILKACRRTGAQAVHPGYGFLSENVEFAKALVDAGITFIGPDVHSINMMGDKIRSKNHVIAHGVPVVPGIAEPGLSNEQLVAAAAGVGFPLLIKPSAGGGGKGMHIVERAEDLPATLETARRVAKSSFGDDTLFLERLVRSPRHIEVQVLADRHGNIIHLGERECSLQRRHQKVIEEAPAPLLQSLPNGAGIRARIGAAAVDAARSVNYVGAGTVEFLVSDEAPDEFFFMEMNTRLQVEHPVTEEVVRVHGQRLDLVEWQVRIAAGDVLTVAQSDVVLEGHAIEARVYAEDPSHGFMPSIGRLLQIREPSGPGIRVDSSLTEGLEVSPHYDPMIAKVIVWNTDREQALGTLDRALADTVLLGVKTNVEYLRLLIADEDVAAGRLDTTLIDRKIADMPFRTFRGEDLALAAHALAASQADAPGPWGARDGWRVGRHAAASIHLEIDGKTHTVTASLDAQGQTFDVDGEPFRVNTLADGSASVNGTRRRVATAVTADGTAWLGIDGWGGAARRLSRLELLQRRLDSLERDAGTVSPEVRSPMPGTVIAVVVADFELVEEGQPLLSIEAMKMEHQLTAPVSGVVRLSLKVGDLVKAAQIVATVEPLSLETGDADPAAEAAAAQELEEVKG